MNQSYSSTNLNLNVGQNLKIHVKHVKIKNGLNISFHLIYQFELKVYKHNTNLRKRSVQNEPEAIAHQMAQTSHSRGEPTLSK